MARIGLIQTAGIGDIVIALPIAKAFAARGATVFWPVDVAYAGFLARVAPYAYFIPVPRTTPEDFAMLVPQAELRGRKCDSTYVLYSYIFGDTSRLQNKDFTDFLKFDEYKYAVTGIPFQEKWQLKIERDMAREEALFKSLQIHRQFICIHRKGANFLAQFAIPDGWKRDYQIVEIDERSDSPFDWISTLERAAKLICVDSCFANLIEQLNLPNEKYLIFRTPSPYTPVMKNGWRFVSLDPEKNAAIPSAFLPPVP